METDICTQTFCVYNTKYADIPTFTCLSVEKANELVEKLGPDWAHRPDLADQPPAWSSIQVPFTLAEARRLAAAHGVEQLVILALIDKGLNVVTVGDSAESSRAAADFVTSLMQAMGYDMNNAQAIEGTIPA